MTFPFKQNVLVLAGTTNTDHSFVLSIEGMRTMVWRGYEKFWKTGDLI